MSQPTTSTGIGGDGLDGVTPTNPPASTSGLPASQYPPAAIPGQVQQQTQIPAIQQIPVSPVQAQTPTVVQPGSQQIPASMGQTPATQQIAQNTGQVPGQMQTPAVNTGQTPMQIPVVAPGQTPTQQQNPMNIGQTPVYQAGIATGQVPMNMQYTAATTSVPQFATQTTANPYQQYAQYGYVPMQQSIPQSMQQQPIPAQVPQMQPVITVTGSPWGRIDVGAFLKTCDTILPFDGRNWGQYRFSFSLLCKSFGLKGFLDDPAPWGTGYAYPVNDITLENEYNQLCIAVYNGIYKSCTEVIRYRIKQYADWNYPGAQTWSFLSKEYSSEKQMNQASILHQLQTLIMVPGQHEAYIAEKLRLRDCLFAIQHPIANVTFNSFLLEGVPDDWYVFKTSMRTQLRTILEEDLIGCIRDEDLRMQAQENPERIYAAKVPSRKITTTQGSSSNTQHESDNLHCTFCNKDGHTAAKCWNKPPYYCIRCKKTGHSIGSCTKGKKGETQDGKSSKGEPKHAKSAGKKKVNEQTLMVVPPPKEQAALEIGHYTIERALQTIKVEQLKGVEHEKGMWIMDSGATSHMTPHAHFFSEMRMPTTPKMVMTGSRELMQVTGIGTIRATSNKGVKLALQNVLLVPKLAASLLSLAKMLHLGVSSEAKGKSMKIYKGSETFLTFELKENLFQTCLQITEKVNAQLDQSFNVQNKKVIDEHATLNWHKRLGHMSQAYMKHLLKHELALGFPLSNVSDFTCDDCHRGKIIQQPYSKDVEKLPVTEKLGLVHIDICGPFPTSRHGYKYFAAITDDATRYRWLLLLRKKEEMFSKFSEWLPYAETQSEKKLKALRSDHGPEFTSYAFEDFLRSKGIDHQYSIAFHPPQNGVAERLNRTLEDKTRTMLITAKLPVGYWEYAMKYATWLINRSASSSLLNQKLTPYEAWTGKKASVAGVHTFGCMAVCYVPKIKRDHKLSPTGEWLLYLGMSEDHKAWLLVNPSNGKETEVRSAHFHENKYLKDWRSDNNMAIEETVVPFEKQETLPQPQRDFKSMYRSEVAPYALPEQEAEKSFVSLIIQEDEFSFYMDNLSALFTGELPPEPKTAEEALTGPYAEKWKEAMDSEIHTLLERGTWELTELPPGKKPVGVKWVFKVKTKVDGSLDKFKARLVAKGFTQIAGEDFYEIFAPVSDYTTARMLLAVAAVKRYAITQLDVKNAFLYGEIDANIYMKQPDGYHDGTTKVCKLVKALYGLKQSPRMWYYKLSAILEKNHFVRSIHDEALFINRKQPDKPVWCLIYVDDILMTSPSKDMLNETVEGLKGDLTLTTSDTLSQYLGMNLWQTDSGEICLSADKYVEKLEKKFDLTTGGRRAETPLPVAEPEGMEPVTAMTEFQYLSRVGSLLYAATCCRPDLQHAVSTVAQASKQRHQIHCFKLDRILKYMLQSRKTYLCYGTKGSDLTLRGYCDSSFGPTSKSDTNLRSSYGWVFTLGGSAISWAAKRFNSTSLNVCEAELMAIKEAFAQAIHLQALLKELGVDQDGPTNVHTDSKAAYDTAKSENFSKRLKHVTIARQWVREQLANGNVDVKLVRTFQQPADFFTKPLPASAFKTCCNLLGLKIPSKEDKSIEDEDQDNT